jgi:hypothetical protein
MRQFTSQRVFFEPSREFGRSEAGFPDPHQLLQLAMERALAPPLIHMRSMLQPMRVIVVQPDSVDANVGANQDFGSQTLLPLPQATDSFPYAESEFRQRVVQGEILSDENGQLYEKLGDRIRQIHQLASGPSGELIELAPAGQVRLHLLGAPAGPRIVGRHKTTNAPAEHEQVGAFASTFIPLTSSPEKPAVPTHRKLFADPGQWRVVWWGEFKEILAKQLAHPERLRDSYRLPCYVQVFETERAVTIDELAAAYALENERQTPLYFLTDEIATKLDLISLLPPLVGQPGNEQRAPRSLLPHDRVFRLLVANDPTVDVANLKTPESKTAPNAMLKLEIPARFIKEWEFKISREEALYDMNARPTISGLVGRFFHRFRVFKLRNEFRKWQALLAGRDLDEQLWGVRPPGDMLGHTFVRDWLVRTLMRGGYDSQKMTSEWEVFWRRKQV